MECRGDRTLVPFRYQGQYEDVETGLYYNRFRYYSPQIGMYISSDPIGLAGNNPTLYGYVYDVNTWLDKWGLFAALYRMRLQIQKGTENIISKVVESSDPITAKQLEKEMMDMIDNMKSVRPDLVPRAHGAASSLSKKIRRMIEGGGNGISNIGNVMREWFSGKKGENIRFDVENLEGINLKCKS